MIDLLTAKEVSSFLKLSESTVYKLAKTGELPGFKIEDSVRFERNQLMKVIQEKMGIQTEDSVGR